jgi:hypothetical protein
MSSKRRGWTAEDIAKLRELAGKRPVSSIALALDRGIAATSVKAHSLGISLRQTNVRKPTKSAAVPTPSESAPA